MSEKGKTACLECVAGSYCEAGASAALPCPSGRHQNGTMTALNVSMTSVDDCVICPVGAFCSTGAAEPTECSAGTVQPLVEQGTCEKCDAGKYQNGQGETACFECVAGSYCEAGASAALPCLAGTSSSILALGSSDQCAECAAGTFCFAGSTAATNCSVGTYAAEPRSELCFACPKGKYQGSEGSSACEDCSDGYTCPKGSVVQIPASCEAGTFLNVTLAATLEDPMDACFGCPPGSVCAGGASQPRLCGRGTFAADHATESSDCPAGRFGSEWGLTNASCSGECEQGYYCEAGSVSAKAAPCAEGSYSNATGLESQANCTACPEGHSCGVGVSQPTPCSAGRVAPNASMANCLKCAPGTMQPAEGQRNCTACGVGGYCVEGAMALTLCEEGSFGNTTARTSQSECHACPAGSSCAVGSTEGTPCRPGTVQPNTSQGTCINCAAGKYQAGPGQTACDECTVGGFCVEGAPTVALCATRTYGNESGLLSQSSCRPCPAGSMCLAGSTAPTPCPAGTFAPNTSSDSCTACAAGKYQNAEGATACDLCGLGGYCEAGAAVLKNCEAGTFGNHSGLTAQSGCHSCPPGSSCSLGSKQPAPCASGTYSSDYGASACTDCAAGTFQDDEGRTACKLCDEGGYCLAGASSPKLCKPGTFGNETGLTSQASCFDCPPGSACSLGSDKPTACLSGTFAANSSSDTCKQCPETTYQPSAGQIGCIDCGDGYFCPLGSSAKIPAACAEGTHLPSGVVFASQADCDPCPVRHYCSGGNTAPKLCSVGTFANKTGLADCTDCAAGSYQDGEGGTSCALCPTGGYCLVGAATVKLCAAGSFGNKTGLASQGECRSCPKGSACTLGAIAPMPCAAGTVAPSASSEECSACVAGSFQGGKGQTACEPCAAGGYCEQGAVAPTLCAPGTYSTDQGNAVAGDCKPCPPGSECRMGARTPMPCASGTFADQSNMAQCRPCEAGTYQEHDNSTGCNVCNMGGYCPPEAAAVVQCPAGRIGKATGLSEEQDCQAVPPGSSSAMGAVEAMPCGLGTVQPLAGQAACVECVAGTFINDVGQTACLACPRSAFCRAGASAALPCAQGSFSNTSGLGSSEQCTDCPEGAFCSTGAAEPTECSAGTVQPLVEQGTCEKCDAGKYQNGQGETACFECVAGSYCEAGASAALPCPSGRHQNGTMTALNVSMTSVDDCVICPVGAFCSTGAAEPTECSAGTVQPLVEQGTCEKCDAGKYQNGQGETACFECVAGSYCEAGASAALPCPSGRHQNGTMTALNVSMTSVDDCVICPVGAFCSTGAAEPTECSAGTVQPATEQGTCVSCAVGRYQAETGETACDACTPGSYCPERSSTPLPCPSGRYQNDTMAMLNLSMTSENDCLECPAGSACNTGSKEPGLCAPGSFAAVTGMLACTRCAAGSFQGGEGATACEECTTASWCGEGSSAPTPCAAGYVGRGTGLRTADGCEPCPQGSWCSAGNDIACPSGTYNTQTGQSDQGACSSCPAMSVSPEASISRAACVCLEGYYDSDAEPEEVTCVQCQVGSACAGSGVTLTRLPLAPGYYRTGNASSDLRRCPDAAGNNSGCVGGVGDGEGPCREWLEGPYCLLCNTTDDSRYYDADESVCLPCEVDDLRQSAILIVSGGGLALLLLALLWARFKLHRSARFQPLIGRCKSLSAQLSLRSKLKQLLGFYQIATRVADVYEVPMPAAVASLLAFFELLNINIDGVSLLPLQCFGLGTYEQRLTFTMLVPCVLAAAIFLVFFLRSCCGCGPKNRGMGLMAALPYLLTLSFLVFPMVSSAAFRAFSCETFDNGREFLRADYRVECSTDVRTSDAHETAKGLAWLGLGLYPCGISLLYALLLYRARFAILGEHQSALSKALRFITQEYEPSYFYWELLEAWKKLFLVGFAVLIPPGSVEQLVIAFLVSLVYMLLVAISCPYREDSDNAFANGCNFSLIALFFCCTVLKLGTLTEEVGSFLSPQLLLTYGFDPGLVTVGLIACVAGALVVAALMAAEQLFRASRRPVIKLVDTGAPPVLERREAQKWHLLLSHAPLPSTGVDMCATIKQQLGALLPGVRICYSAKAELVVASTGNQTARDSKSSSMNLVTNLVESSQAVMICVAKGYFLSKPCVRVAREAVQSHKPLSLLHNPLKAGAPLEVIKAEECPAELRAGVFDGRDVLVWQREQRNQLSLKGGHAINSDVAGPFEMVTLKQLAMQLIGACPNTDCSQLARGLYVPDELTRSRWSFAPRKCRRWCAAPKQLLVYHSEANNPSAMAALHAVCQAPQLKQPGAAMPFQVAPLPTRTQELRLAAADKHAVFMLHLSRATFRGEAGNRLANEVRAVRYIQKEREFAGELQLLMLHENDPAEGGAELSACLAGAPADLGLGSEPTVALHPGSFHELSCCLVAQALGASKAGKFVQGDVSRHAHSIRGEGQDAGGESGGGDGGKRRRFSLGPGQALPEPLELLGSFFKRSSSTKEGPAVSDEFVVDATPSAAASVTALSLMTSPALEGLEDKAPADKRSRRLSLRHEELDAAGAGVAQKERPGRQVYTKERKAQAATLIQAAGRGRLARRRLRARTAAAVMSKSQPPSTVGKSTDDGWRMEAWLDGLGAQEGVEGAVAVALRAGEAGADADELGFARGLDCSEAALRMRLSQGALVEKVSKSLAGAFAKLQQAEAMTASELHDKFSLDGKSFELQMGGLETFYGGLEGIVGPPQPKVMEGMVSDHCSMPDSEVPFTMPNQRATGTSVVEWRFVASPAGGADGHGAPFEPYPNAEKSRKARPFEEFKKELDERNEKLAQTKQPTLQREEFLGARLYTGPMYMKYNAVLRGLQFEYARPAFDGLCKGNKYATTLHAINSAIIKLSKLTVAGKVYRGVSGGVLPEACRTPNAYGVRGGVEAGFMSTSFDRKTALFYAVGAADKSKRGSSAIVFETQMGMVDRGADVAWLSEFPHEAEILFAPLTGMEVRGSRVEGAVQVFEVVLTVNMASLTIEQVIGKRRKVVCDMCEQLKETAWREAEGPSWDLLRSAQQSAGRPPPPVEAFVSQRILPLAAKGFAHYNENGPLGDAIQEAVARADILSGWPQKLEALAAVAVVGGHGEEGQADGEEGEAAAAELSTSACCQRLSGVSEPVRHAVGLTSAGVGAAELVHGTEALELSLAAVAAEAAVVHGVCALMWARPKDAPLRLSMRREGTGSTGCYLGADGLATLSKAMTPTLAALDLEGSSCADNGGDNPEGVWQLCMAIECYEFSGGLLALSLAHNALGHAAGTALAAAVARNRTLHSLDLHHNPGYGSAAVIELAAALRTNETLASLNLGYTGVDDQVALALADALQRRSSSLTSLTLYSNAITNGGAKAFAIALKADQCTLTHLDLSGNQIGGRGGSDVAGALKSNRHLTSLRLASNRLGREGGEAIERALKSNASLTILDLSNTGLDAATTRLIDATLARRAPHGSADPRGPAIAIDVVAEPAGEANERGASGLAKLDC